MGCQFQALALAAVMLRNSQGSDISILPMGQRRLRAVIRCHTEGAELEFEGRPPGLSKCQAPEIPLWPRDLRPQRHTLSPPGLLHPLWSPFPRGGYKWLLLACGSVWGG